MSHSNFEPLKSTLHELLPGGFDFLPGLVTWHMVPYVALQMSTCDKNELVSMQRVLNRATENDTPYVMIACLFVSHVRVVCRCVGIMKHETACFYLEKSCLPNRKQHILFNRRTSEAFRK